MKNLIPVLLGAALMAGCSGGNSNNSASTNLPPVEPPVEPMPPAMQSFAAFVRTAYADDANAMPREINNIQFNQDAVDDDFSDLLQ